jgi:hypothetical protein
MIDFVGQNAGELLVELELGLLEPCDQALMTALFADSAHQLSQLMAATFIRISAFHEKERPRQAL